MRENLTHYQHKHSQSFIDEYVHNKSKRLWVVADDENKVVQEHSFVIV